MPIVFPTLRKFFSTPFSLKTSHRRVHFLFRTKMNHLVNQVHSLSVTYCKLYQTKNHHLHLNFQRSQQVQLSQKRNVKSATARTPSVSSFIVNVWQVENTVVQTVDARAVIIMLNVKLLATLPFLRSSKRIHMPFITLRRHL